MTRTKTVDLTYTGDQLTFSSLHVWYTYKAASQQLLDSWKEKRMTGFKFSWRIEKASVIWTSSISEVGRSIQTPGLGKTFTELNMDADSYYTYHAVLKVPEEVQNQIGNGSLVIELDVGEEPNGERSEEVVFGFKGYQLHRQKTKRGQAELQCKLEGGHLASLHSQSEQAKAKEVADNHTVWLGGQKKRFGGWY